MARSLSNRKYLLSRKNKKTGFTETVIYTGNLNVRPKGWHLVKELY